MKKKIIFVFIFFVMVFSSIFVMETFIFSEEECDCVFDVERQAWQHCRSKCRRREDGGCGFVWMNYSKCISEDVCGSSWHWECNASSKHGSIKGSQYCGPCNHIWAK